MCHHDLEQLVEWQNLTARHDGGRSSALEEYFKKKCNIPFVRIRSESSVCWKIWKAFLILT
ncbi:DUF2397 family protein [Paenibacillus cisolokensis]|uniref:DUF2397 family protein n=1 Tax=Paenibacillus cisolokensis TaxID=1658519 RepID=UPI001FD4AED5|nr:DUF2397 family protein [Paenibacillus cisolokensis]